MVRIISLIKKFCSNYIFLSFMLDLTKKIMNNDNLYHTTHYRLCAFHIKALSIA
jgi:hypothetical protein